MQLTYKQCKALIGTNIDVRAMLDAFTNQPKWLTCMQEIGDLEEVAGIIQGGCASGAYMPAVRYYDAEQACQRYMQDLLEFIDNEGYPLPEQYNPRSENWGGYCVRVVSAAVEIWCLQWGEVVEVLDNHDCLYN